MQCRINHRGFFGWKWKYVTQAGKCHGHYIDVIMSAMASQITGVSIIYSNVCSGADQRKHQSSASLAFVRGIHRWPVNSPHKGPVTRKMFSFDDVIMQCASDSVFVCVPLTLMWSSFCEAHFIMMMTSSNGNIFRVTGHLCGEFIRHRWIPRAKASDAEIWCFLLSAPE